MTRLRFALVLLAAFAAPAGAQDLQWHGFVDLRVATAANQDDWRDGGLGKTRYGGDDAGGGIGGGVLAANFQATPQLLATAELQWLPGERHQLDVIDASLRYRPVSTTPWRWSVRAGAFFPPVSLENDGIGWTATRTLTPSAINSWIGEELRTIGVEAVLEHRGDAGTWQATTAVFGWNDPAGELLAARGWALGDLTTGLRSRVREPDVYAPVAFGPVPLLYHPFVELDHRVGWYAGVGWSGADGGRLQLLRYDNRADATRHEHYAGREVFGWDTRFWSLGAERRFGDVVVTAQAIDGVTIIEPLPQLRIDTRFSAAYLLASRDYGTWQPAVRIDLFRTRQPHDSGDTAPSEHGNALTIALSWRPQDRIRVTGEWLRIDSRRNQRKLAGLAPRQIDSQMQLSLRWLF